MSNGTWHAFARKKHEGNTQKKMPSALREMACILSSGDCSNKIQRTNKVLARAADAGRRGLLGFRRWPAEYTLRNVGDMAIIKA